MARYDLDGKVALVTGGARGIGFATCRALIARGAHVALVDLDEAASNSAASELHDRGARVVAVSDVSGGLHDERGLDIPVLHAYAAEHGSLEGYDRCDRITNEQLLALECDVLVLAAREDQLTSANADRVQALVVVEVFAEEFEG